MIDRIRNEWNTACDVPNNETPTLIHQDQAVLMFKLIYEELLELKQGIDKGDLVEIADALADINYLVLGTVNQFGLHKHWDEINLEVHRSNITKCIDGKLTKRDDGKILKPSTYEPPRIDLILNDYIQNEQREED